MYAPATLGNLDNSHAWSAGIGVPIYFERAFHGPFVELGAVAKRVVGLGYSEELGNYAVGQRESGPQAFVGWEWTFPSGMHLSYSLGAWRDLDSGYTGNLHEIRAGFAW